MDIIIIKNFAQKNYTIYPPSKYKTIFLVLLNKKYGYDIIEILLNKFL